MHCRVEKADEDERLLPSSERMVADTAPFYVQQLAEVRLGISLVFVMEIMLL